MRYLRSPDVLDKRPGEELTRSVDLAPWLEAGESLAAVNSVTADAASGLTLDQTAIVGTDVRFRIQGGNWRKAPWVIIVEVTIAGGVNPDVWQIECPLQMFQ